MRIVVLIRVTVIVIWSHANSFVTLVRTVFALSVIVAPVCVMIRRSRSD